MSSPELRAAIARQRRAARNTYGPELHRVMGLDRPMYLTQRALDAIPHAGEWDWLRRLPRRLRRSLIGAGYLTSDGVRPDVAAAIIAAYVPGMEEDVDTALGWYISHAIGELRELRRDRHYLRHEIHAWRHGFDSYYAYRTAQALEYGHGSLWYLRRDRGWS